LPRKKRAIRSGKAHWPILEENVSNMIRERRQNGYVVTQNQIRIFALQWAKSNQDEAKEFKATKSWCARFMKRNDFVIRRQTKIAQKLREELENKIFNFQRFMINQRKKHNYLLSNIGNMDETPMNFDMVGNRTISSKGEKTILLKTTGHEKTRFTVVLACMADGTKLRPMVIFKRKTMPKVSFPKGVFVHVNAKGWMDEEGIKLWIQNVWNRRPNAFRNLRSLLVWDMFKPHLSTDVKRRLATNKTDLALIPGGLTSVLQPLDVCLNKPFKDHMREQWNEWFTSAEKSFTKAGNMRPPSLDTLCEFVEKAWNNLEPSMIESSFKKCCISNAMDGTEDTLIWENDEDCEITLSDDEDPYDDFLTEADENLVNELHELDLEEDDLAGLDK